MVVGKVFAESGADREAGFDLNLLDGIVGCKQQVGSVDMRHRCLERHPRTWQQHHKAEPKEGYHGSDVEDEIYVVCYGYAHIINLFNFHLSIFTLQLFTTFNLHDIAEGDAGTIA